MWEILGKATSKRFRPTYNITNFPKLQIRRCNHNSGKSTDIMIDVCRAK